MMHAYASRTGTLRNQKALRDAGWRVLVSPYTMWGLEKAEREGTLNSIDGFKNAAADNGAWSDYQRGCEFDGKRFTAFMKLVGPLCDFGIVPDIVLGGEKSFERSISWLDECLDHFKTVVIPVQNGMTVEMVAPFIGPRVGVFVGGDSKWKEETVGEWAALCREARTWCHVGRVNTVRRISICECAGATSFDGSSVTKYAVTLPKLDNGRRQESLLRYW